MSDTTHEAPERIWIWGWRTDSVWQEQTWQHEDEPMSTMEYVRSDLVQVAEQRGYANAMEAERKLHEARVAELEAERNEADRRAGAAEREMQSLKDSAAARSHWLYEAKQERGYHDNVSFDVVWKEVCEKADRAEAAEALLSEAVKAGMLFAEATCSEHSKDHGSGMFEEHSYACASLISVHARAPETIARIVAQLKEGRG